MLKKLAAQTRWLLITRASFPVYLFGIIQIRVETVAWHDVCLTIPT